MPSRGTRRTVEAYESDNPQSSQARSRSRSRSITPTGDPPRARTAADQIARGDLQTLGAGASRDVPTYTDAQMWIIHHSLRKNHSSLLQQGYEEYGRRASEVGRSLAEAQRSGIYPRTAAWQYFLGVRTAFRNDPGIQNIEHNLRLHNTQVKSFNNSLRARSIPGLRPFLKLSLGYKTMNQAYREAEGQDHFDPFIPEIPEQE